MPDYDSYAAAVTVRENVLRTALQSAYAEGSAASRQFGYDLSYSDATITPTPYLFLGEPDIDCDGRLVVDSGGAPGAIVVTLPMWGPVTVKAPMQTQTETLTVTVTVDIAGEVKLAIFPQLDHGTDASNIVFTNRSQVTVPSWDATVTTPGTPEFIIDLLTGDGFRQTLESLFQAAVLTNMVSLPDIPAGFLIDLPAAATSFAFRIRDRALIIGLVFSDDARNLNGTPDSLQDFAGAHDLAAVVNPAAADLMFTRVRAALASGAQSNDATLETFGVTSESGLFACSGTISESEGSLNFSFELVPSMFHTRDGAYFTYVPKQPHVNGRTWPALTIGIENVQTDVDQAWWVTLLDVVLALPTIGYVPLYIEAKIDSLVSTFRNKITSFSPGTPAARVQKTVPGPGGIAVRIGVDQFDVATDGVRVGISVRPTRSPAVLYGPTVVPQTYMDDTLRYILQVPSAIDAVNDPALRMQWLFEDRDANVVLSDTDGPLVDRLKFEFIPASFSATHFGLTVRLYRQLGPDVTNLGFCSLNLHMRPALAPESYVRWLWQGKNPQVVLDVATESWRYNGNQVVNRWSNWHRTDAPCNAVHAPARYRYNVETADRLPFDLKLLENHREGMCSYCFYGGPAGINAQL